MREEGNGTMQKGLCFITFFAMVEYIWDGEQSKLIKAECKKYGLPYFDTTYNRERVIEQFNADRRWCKDINHKYIIIERMKCLWFVR